MFSANELQKIFRKPYNPSSWFIVSWVDVVIKSTSGCEVANDDNMNIHRPLSWMLCFVADNVFVITGDCYEWSSSKGRRQTWSKYLLWNAQNTPPALSIVSSWQREHDVLHATLVYFVQSKLFVNQTYNVYSGCLIAFRT